ncbi:hypothetical protein PUW81_007595 [Microbacterium sp. NM3R9]|uniref:hypothetical protein n=1 Tax=Microbacterium thalli TaxID=3027921 RepID=UPI002366C4F3|nr:hypothetical protein [Microbacterium thalli]MDN8548967.1 hypothetical protein [Microbacterium thalli]
MTALTAGAAVLSLGGALAAQALWGAALRTSVPVFPVGSVAFAAFPSDRPDAPQSSEDGEAVSLRIPGALLAEIIEPPEGTSKPVVWRFTAQGSAPGIAGMDYDVSVREQLDDGATHDLSSGHALPGTVLAGSTMKVFRAGLGGDCSAIPETPPPNEGEAPRNVHVFDGEDVRLQDPGAGVPGAMTTHEWCAVVEWNHADDGRYRNDVTVSGVGENGSVNHGIAAWHAVVGVPPALEMAGTYLGRAAADGSGENGARVRAEGEWYADLYPDPFGEPDIVIALQPAVTSPSPDVAAGD